MIPKKHSICILGASGYIGNAIYRELCTYYKTVGTYCTAHDLYDTNKAFYHYDVDNSSLTNILEEVQPTILISSLRGNFKAQYHAHKELCKYIANNPESRLIYISSANVFDGASQLPAYEDQRPCSISEYGKFKISVEKLLFEKIPNQLTIARLPMVLGAYSPRLIQLKQAVRHQAVFDIYPNLIISITTADKVAQQLHYTVNKGVAGILHLASSDMIHHQDLFTEICEKIDGNTPIFKTIYTSNDDQYLAILPKNNSLPKNYQITVAEVIDNCVLEDISMVRK